MKKTIFVVLLLLFTITACNTSPQTAEPDQSQTVVPLTEADVPRVTVEDAKFAVDNGQAIIVDVRSTEFYFESHIADALSFPLDGIEIDPAGVPLDKAQWIITYCT